MGAIKWFVIPIKIFDWDHCSWMVFCVLFKINRSYDICASRLFFSRSTSRMTFSFTCWFLFTASFFLLWTFPHWVIFGRPCMLNRLLPYWRFFSIQILVEILLYRCEILSNLAVFNLRIELSIFQLLFQILDLIHKHRHFRMCFFLCFIFGSKPYMLILNLLFLPEII